MPLLIEAFRTSGAAAVLDERVTIKRRNRGLSPAALVEGLFARWAAGGDRYEDLTPLREDAGSRSCSAMASRRRRRPGTFRRCSTRRRRRRGGACRIPGEGERLQGLVAAGRRLIGFFQERAPRTTATIDLDATILESHKPAARPTFDGRTGYQPVIALWAEQDVVLADEFRDGSVPAGTGNRRLVERAVAALPPGVERALVRADSAAYEHDLLRCLDASGIGTPSAPT